VSLAWYRGIAPVYDWVCRPLYAAPRRRSIKLLELSPNESVLDLCCGTGLNFPALADALQGQGAIVGVDFTAAMLKSAHRRAHALQSRHEQLHIRVEEKDAACFDRHSWAQLGLNSPRPDAVLCSYGLAVAPNWRAIADQAWELLRPGGRFVVVDNQPFPRAPLRWTNPLTVPISNFLGQAELQRKLGEPFHAKAAELAEEQQCLGGYVFVRRYEKPRRPAPD